MDVRLAEACRRDANELRLALQFRAGGPAAVAHAGAHAAHELMDHRGDAALVGDAALDSFRHQLLAGGDAVEIEIVLEVSVAAAAPHRADRSHPAVVLVRAALVKDDLAGALVGAGE